MKRFLFSLFIVVLSYGSATAQTITKTTKNDSLITIGVSALFGEAVSLNNENINIFYDQILPIIDRLKTEKNKKNRKELRKEKKALYQKIYKNRELVEKLKTAINAVCSYQDKKLRQQLGY